MTTKALAILFLIMPLWGCSDDPPPTIDPPIEGTTIVDVAIEDGRFSTLVGALQATGLDAALESEGPFTVFAPTDDAFALLPEGLVESLDTDTLATVLTYHVIEGEVPAATAVTLTEATTLEGSTIALGLAGDDLYLNGLTLVTITDIEADNGIIHVIDSVLIPGEFPGTIVDVVTSYPRLSTLAGAATPAAVEALSADDRTLFAPVNSAFEGVELPTDLDPILLYHALAEESAAPVIVDSTTLQTANGAFLAVRDVGAGVALNDSRKDTNIIYTDIETRNGVIHLIDDVLVPPGDIAEVAVRSGFSTLAALVTDAGLLPAIQGEGPLTVFAPTDDAFAALPADADLSGVLGDILLHHVLEGAVDSSAVVAAIEAGAAPTTLTSAADNELQLAALDGSVVINGLVTVSAVDVPAANGIIHVIDSIILPSDIAFPGSIAEAVAAYPNLSSLYDAVLNADPLVATALSGEGDFTVFAPHDPAFEGVDTSSDLTTVLLYHTLDVRADSSVVGGLVGSDVTTLMGGDLTVQDGPVLVDAAGNVRNVLRVDLRTANGIIHVIDGILFPM
jgi:transforming growth factor-beta-induced protein